MKAQRTNRAKSPQNILWAVDAFAGPIFSDENRIELLRLLSSKRGTRIEPVYVLSPEGLNFSLPLAPEWAGKYRFAAESSLKAVLKDVHIPGLAKPRVLVQPRPSNALSTLALIRYAKKSKADLIAVDTHARSGLSRFFLGSFAENLVLHSKTPVLVTQQKTQIAPLKRILFPTDLKQSSFPLFKKVVALAKDRGLAIRVVHVLTEPVEAAFQAGTTMLGGGWIGSAPKESVLASNQDKLEKWCAVARVEGVPCDSSLICAAGSVTENILKEAKSIDPSKSCQMIAMAAQSGPIATALLGSVARQVMRQSDVPVWIIRA